MKHSLLLDLCIKNLYENYKNNIRVFKRPTGTFRALYSPAIIRTSIEGLSDLYGFYSKNDNSYHFEIEVKAKKDTLREGQLRWKSICESLNCAWFLYKEGNTNEFDKKFKNWVSLL